MQFTGRVLAITNQRSGQSAKGEWMAMDFVMEENSVQYPKKIALTAMGDPSKVQGFGIEIGASLCVQFDINAREYNGRWYNDMRVWQVTRL